MSIHCIYAVELFFSRCSGVSVCSALIKSILYQITTPVRSKYAGISVALMLVKVGPSNTSHQITKNIISRIVSVRKSHLSVSKSIVMGRRKDKFTATRVKSCESVSIVFENTPFPREINGCGGFVLTR